MKRCTKCGETKEATAEFFYRNKRKKDGLATECKLCDNARQKRPRKVKRKKERDAALFQENKDKFYDRKRKWIKDNPEKHKEMMRRGQKRYYDKQRNNPEYKIKKTVGVAIRKALKNQGNAKDSPTFSALPYSPQDLVEHLERQFDEKMSWDNYGDYWHVDHIYPQSLLPYSSLKDENFQKCWALENLQPLEATENMKKSNKVL